MLRYIGSVSIRDHASLCQVSSKQYHCHHKPSISDQRASWYGKVPSDGQHLSLLGPGVWYEGVYSCVLGEHALQQPSKTLKDLLRGVLPESHNTADLCRWVEGRNGKGILFILDGWNSNQQHPHSITNRLVSKKYLSKCTIVLTCTFTPPSLKQWYQYDLLGLTSAQISTQVAHYHSTDPLKAEAVLIHLASNPDMKQLASFPVYLYAILLISDHMSPSDLPETWTECSPS